MNFHESSYCGSLWHHGIKGQKWGVRRSKEELGHGTKTKVEKHENHVIIQEPSYYSKKGFSIRHSKLKEWCLKPGIDHYEMFELDGYKPSDSYKLFKDIEKGFDLSKKKETKIVDGVKEKYSIPIMLGVTRKRMYRTVWQRFLDEDEIRFVTAYFDSSFEED